MSRVYCSRCAHGSCRNAPTCPPEHLVWCPLQGETEEDAITIRARDAEQAAEAWAERSDRESADYTIVRGSEARICVRTVLSGELRRFIVRGESVPKYDASEDRTVGA